MTYLVPAASVTKLRVLYKRIKVDIRQSYERLVWWTGGGAYVPEVIGSILVAVIVSLICAGLPNERIK